MPPKKNKKKKLTKNHGVINCFFLHFTYFQVSEVTENVQSDHSVNIYWKEFPEFTGKSFNRFIFCNKSSIKPLIGILY